MFLLVSHWDLPLLDYDEQKCHNIYNFCLEIKRQLVFQSHILGPFSEQPIFPFSNLILMCVGLCQLTTNPMLFAKFIECSQSKFTSSIYSQITNFCIGFCFHNLLKILEFVEGFIFLLHEENPCFPWKIVCESNKILRVT